MARKNRPSRQPDLVRYHLTPEEALSLERPGEAIPLVDRPLRQHEWGVTPGEGGPEVLTAISGERGQGRFIFGGTGEFRGGTYKDVLDPANLPRHDSGTYEERRKAASTLRGLESERTRPSPTHAMGLQAAEVIPFPASTKVQNPSGVKDTIAETGIPPTMLTELSGVLQTGVAENTRDTSIREKQRQKRPTEHYLSSKGTGGRKGKLRSRLSRPRSPDSEVIITSRADFHSGVNPPSTRFTVAHELGHGMHHLSSHLETGEDYPFQWGPPRGTGGGPKRRGASPHLEGVADAFAEMYHSPDAPVDETDDLGYSVNSPVWQGDGDDPALKHVYETTRLHTKATGATEGLENALGSRAVKPILGIMERLTNPNSAYVRTSYATRADMGGANWVRTRTPYDYNTPEGGRWIDSTSYEFPTERSVTAGRDLWDKVIQNVAVGTPRRAAVRPSHGRQLSLGLEGSPDIDLVEQPWESTKEARRAGEEHLNRIKSDLKTWLL